MINTFAVHGTVFIYALGVVAVQSHLGRYSVAEAGLIDVQYFAVGGWIVVAALPALTAVGLSELYLARVPRFLLVLAALLVAGVASALVVYQVEYDVLGAVFDLNAYPYPSRFIIWNLASWNVLLVATWFLAFVCRQLEMTQALVGRFSLAIAIVLAFLFSVFFGRVVYPALSTSVGGGAPRFAELVTPEAQAPVLVIYTTGEVLCYLELESLPERFDLRSSTTQFVGDEQSPVWKALARNRIVLRRWDRVTTLTLLGFTQEPLLRRYLDER